MRSDAMSIMNLTQLTIGYIAGGLALIQIIPYVISILKGHNKPERATFAIWSLVNILIVSSYIASGARETIWVGLAYTVASITIFILSFKYGMGGLSKFDVLCLLLAGLGIVCWITTDNPVLVLYLYIGIKFLGLMSTIIKAYRYPKTENILAWTLSTFASTLNLFAISVWIPQIRAFPIYSFFGETIVTVILLTANFQDYKSFKKKLSAIYEVQLSY